MGLGEYLTSPVQHFRFSQSGAKRTFGQDVGKVVVYFSYAESPDSLESATYKGVVLDEAGQKAFKRESWGSYPTPCRYQPRAGC